MTYRIRAYCLDILFVMVELYLGMLSILFSIYAVDVVNVTV